MTDRELADQLEKWTALVDDLRADLDWATLLARAAGTRDVGWREQRGRLYIGGGHPSKDRAIPCTFRDGLPVETPELRTEIEAAL